MIISTSAGEQAITSEIPNELIRAIPLDPKEFNVVGMIRKKVLDDGKKEFTVRLPSVLPEVDLEVGPSLIGSSKLPANADTGQLPPQAAHEKVSPFVDQPLKLLGKDPIMTSIKRTKNEKNDKIGQNDGE
ncbi:hypothetical protein CQW23_16339 [Capsicum baccatum]|uniref:Uncharacterized protein n=1 Tax=Capsicum baccatum TaxID=33114 RepID=A0A2G2WAP8_CAPBA|nr:hypothetical protein CQW23_16339 [Capsicum baccatum]